MFRKRIFGIPSHVIAGTGIGIFILLVIGFISGSLGQAIFGNNPLNAIATGKPHIQLPPEILFTIGNFGVSNTLITSWISIIILVVFCWLITRRLRIIPGRVQSVFEIVFEWLLNFCKEVAGEENGRRFFPLVTTIFLFVLLNAWMNLIPGFGSILVRDIEGNMVPLFREANTDINLPLALALISSVFVLYHGIKARGLPFFKEWFNFGRLFKGFASLFKGRLKSGAGDIFMGIIDVFTGLLEFVSYFFRIASFTFRLFGNMTGGEILILMMIFLVPWVLAVPFYGLELLIGVIQALVFAGLTLVFAAVATTTHEA
ncbi:MAG: F0F1 ATP synthase subunit A [Dehalococcoidales bacterium]|nr:F0F1 ATP synthase subunit A [Dehalococcoidales bacterium]